MRTLGLKSLAIGGVLLGLGLAASSTHALPLDTRTMYIGFNRSVALPGVELSAGTYVFELASPMSDNSLVRVTSRDRRTIYMTAFTYRIDRPANLKPGQVITFGEVRRGEPVPITAWFPDETGDGRGFIYWK
jgi:hypothetical protein